MRARFTCAWGGRPSYRCIGTAFSFRTSPLGRWLYLGWPTPCWPSYSGSLPKSPLVMISNHSFACLCWHTHTHTYIYIYIYIYVMGNITWLPFSIDFLCVAAVSKSPLPIITGHHIFPVPVTSINLYLYCVFHYYIINCQTHYLSLTVALKYILLVNWWDTTLVASLNWILLIIS